MGPTASGKSSLALAVALRLGDIELVSIDSMQVYRGMDIGTAKPSPAEQAEVPHHLIDLADPSEDFSVARFQPAARDALAAIEARGHRALLVGGTGLYLHAVVDGLTVPGTWPRVRAELEAEAATPAGVGSLYRRLVGADPPAAARIEPGNARRIVRALEVTLGSGRPFSSYGPGLGAFAPTARFRIAGLWLPRPVVAARIELRYRAQLDAGFVDEVRSLAGLRPGLGGPNDVAGLRGPNAVDRLSRTARQALGYRELLDHLSGRCSLEEAVDAAIGRTREFARRQRMWFRRDPRVVWFAAARNPLAVLPSLLGHWSQP